MCQAGGTRRGTPPPPGPIPISAHAATVDVAHSRTPHTGGNRGIMRNSIVRSGHGRVPMCADPPHCTWEPDHHTPRPPGKPVIPTKTSRRPAGTPPSHVQHQRQPHPPGTPHPTQPTHHKLQPEPDRSRHGVRPISVRNSTDFAAETDRSRRGDVPISMRSATDFAAETDRSRQGFGPISARNTTDLEK